MFSKVCAAGELIPGQVVDGRLLRLESMSCQVALTGDPRRPTDVRKYTRKKVAEGEQPPDFMLVISMVLGLGALLIKVGKDRK
jgi:hypothetical protein